MTVRRLRRSRPHRLDWSRMTDEDRSYADWCFSYGITSDFVGMFARDEDVLADLFNQAVADGWLDRHVRHHPFDRPDAWWTALAPEPRREGETTREYLTRLPHLLTPHEQALLVANHT